MNEQLDLTDYTESTSQEDFNWTEKRLGDVFNQIYSGGTPKKGVDEYYDGDIPFVKIEDLNKQQLEGVSTAEDHITEKAIEETSARAFEPGTLLLTIYGVLAETAVVQDRVATNQAILGLWDADEDNTLYVKYAIDNDQAKLESLSRQTTQANLGKGIVEKHRVSIPPLEEQRKIASVLYTVDQAIQKTEGIIESLSRIKKGFKQDIFSDGYYDHDRYSEGNIGRIPESWDIKPASELCEDITVGIVTGATDHYVDAKEGVPFIRSQDVHENHIERDELKYISEDFHEQQSSSELHQGDVITVRTGEPGTSCVVPSKLEGANCFSLIISRPKSETNERYYSYYINSPKALDFIDSWKAGGVQDNFNIGVMERLPVPVPSEDEQERIVEALDDINRRIAHERQQVSQLRRLKQGLMQDLLSGEVRTHDKAIELVDDVLQHG